jgi:predicted DCC family thiol-disulfide oxidoreductase YuxK
MKQAPGIIMCLMSDPREGTLIVLYDDDCGFCEVMLAMLLTWDRATHAPYRSRAHAARTYSSTSSPTIA